MKRVLPALFLALSASDAGAQILSVPEGTRTQQPRRDPKVFISASIGWMSQEVVYDGRSGAAWEFGDDVQYRGSLEFEISPGSSLGVVVSHARLPMRFVTLAGFTPPDACPTGACYGDADVQQLMGMFRNVGRAGFHQVVEFQAGVTRWGNFENRNGEELIPGDRDVDFAWSAGYGFGYGLTRATSLAVVFDYGSAIHQNDNLSGNVRSTVPQFTSRLSLRVGF